MLSARAKEIADQAKAQGKWLYDPSYKTWYSPEQFKNTYYYANARDEFINQLQIRHPVEGIVGGFKKLRDIESKLEMFVQRVIEYYNDK